MDLEIENAKLKVQIIELQNVILNFQHQAAVNRLTLLQTKNCEPAQNTPEPHQDMLDSRGG